MLFNLKLVKLLNSNSGPHLHERLSRKVATVPFATVLGIGDADADAPVSLTRRSS